MTDEIEFQEVTEAPKEGLDTSAETEALNNATYESPDFLESKGDYVKSEATVASFVKLVEASSGDEVSATPITLPDAAREVPGEEVSATPITLPDAARETPGEEVPATPIILPDVAREAAGGEVSATPITLPDATGEAPGEEVSATPITLPDAARVAPGEEVSATPITLPDAAREASGEEVSATPITLPDAAREAPGEEVSATPITLPDAARETPGGEVSATPITLPDAAEMTGASPGEVQGFESEEGTKGYVLTSSGNIGFTEMVQTIKELDPQSAIQGDNRRLTQMSNVMKTKRDVDNRQINNVRGGDEGVAGGEAAGGTDTMVTSDQQLENIDLQNMLQKQQQIIQMMSNFSKIINDTALSTIRKVSGGSSDEPGDEAEPGGTSDEPTDESPEVGEIGMSAANLAAPFIPGGSVLSAAVSGVRQSGSSDLSAAAGNGGEEGEGGDNSEEGGDKGSGGEPSGEGEVGTSTDIEVLVQQIMIEVYEGEGDELNDLVDEMQASNEAKSKTRDMLNEMKKLKSESGQKLREQFNAQSTGKDVTLDYNTMEKASDGNFQLVVKSETLPRDQAEKLIGRLEETQVGDLGQDDLVPIEDLNRNALKSNIREGIATLREEIITLRDELADWPDGEPRTITYRVVVKQPDGSYKVVEVTMTMTRDEAKSRADQMENQITTLEREIDAIGSGLRTGEGTGGSIGEGSETSLQGSITVASAQQ